MMDCASLVLQLQTASLVFHCFTWPHPLTNMDSRDEDLRVLLSQLRNAAFTSLGRVLRHRSELAHTLAVRLPGISAVCTYSADKLSRRSHPCACTHKSLSCIRRTCKQSRSASPCSSLCLRVYIACQPAHSALSDFKSFLPEKLEPFGPSAVPPCLQSFAQIAKLTVHCASTVLLPHRLSDSALCLCAVLRPDRGRGVGGLPVPHDGVGAAAQPVDSREQLQLPDHDGPVRLHPQPRPGAFIGSQD